MSDDPMIGTVLGEKYELIRLLGEGGMGTIYEATHKLIGRSLAIKFLHEQYKSNEELVQRFQREAQAAAAIGHDNIVEVTDMGSGPEGAPYIVMEFLKGQDLRDLLNEYGQLSLGRAANIMIQALSALQAAHEAGIIHRDLKPDNIFLTEKHHKSDYVKLLDFGVSKFRSLEPEGTKGLTQTGTVLGTPYYMSPEQARGDQFLSALSDIYSMGVILYQMLTGERPFDAPNYNALMIRILTEDPIPPQELNNRIPDGLAETILMAMSKDPDRRFPDCDAFAATLMPYATDPSLTRSSSQAQAPTAPPTTRTGGVDTPQTPLNTVTTGAVDAPASGLFSKYKYPIIGSAAVLLAVIGWVIIGSGGDPVEVQPAAVIPAAAIETPPSDSTTTSEAPPDPPQKIRLIFAVRPKKAAIAIDGKPLGKSPLNHEVTRDDEDHTLEITKSGFEPLKTSIRFEKDQKLTYRLTKEKSDKPAKKRRSSRSAKRRAKKKDRNRDAAKSSKKPKRRIDNDDPWN